MLLEERGVGKHLLLEVEEQDSPVGHWKGAHFKLVFRVGMEHGTLSLVVKGSRYTFKSNYLLKWLTNTVITVVDTKLVTD